MLKSLLASSCALLHLALAPAAFAQQQTPLPALIRIVVPAAPGASTDVFARAVAAELSTRTGSNVIVENRPGASTMLGSAAVAKGPKDGSMLLINSTSLVSTAATLKDPPLDVVNELTPVAMLEQNPLVVTASVKSNIKTPADLVAAARAGTVTHGTTGVGSIAHILQELFADAAKIKIQHVPYKGTALAVTDMAGGVIDTVIATWATVAPGVNSGRARAIAVTSLQPSAAFPNLPTLASVAPGFSLELWLGIFAPAGTPAAVVQRLNHEINEISKGEKLRQMYAADGGVPLSLKPEEIQPRIREAFATFKKIAAEKNITAE